MSVARCQLVIMRCSARSSLVVARYCMGPARPGMEFNDMEPADMIKLAAALIKSAAEKER